ncbi:MULTISPECIES: hypothetical protein [Acidiphilium]|jgi:hypothetical protein|uniref:Phage tail protein n=3 Tax=Acidiphilium TaxID=522 RepID=A5G1I2_ACICJ|nr:MULTISPECIES: hypothetical protein [Acidiphilium]ABQ31714.1 hypothetical protein Acry_2523 [Acidiphilium cryptum JF-5]KDM65546.1 hypothetical protein ACIDI_99c00050 [Acidiphilium sp. JA12-A1]MBU6357169.1 hypothetical protein [Rhodospirillales bacterium]BAJ82191.1 hypothetical protein ACMV_28440 [Acidiphilium multivorum AIU301]
MADLALTFGGDLAFGNGGDLALAEAAALTEQRVLRRLLTNPGGYVWQLSYGAGLGQFVGAAGPAAAAGALARAQMRGEARVASAPPPQITVSQGNPGGLAMTIAYQDAATGRARVLALPGSV